MDLDPPEDLQAVFAKHFDRSDVEGAKRWINYWAYEMGRPWYTERTMSGHISDYLEGLTGQEPHSYNCCGWKVYYDTQYGTDLYWSIGNPKYKSIDLLALIPTF